MKDQKQLFSIRKFKSGVSSKMDPIDETLKKESVYRVILMYNFSNYFID
ncbi:YSIRK-type signal peptide-containing protein [Staphylococcus delphini]|nr:YSIRK-type signal peptide-containing protein [Staphylococcus delphini]